MMKKSRRAGQKASRKVKGTCIGFVQKDAIPIEVRLYDRLFTLADMSNMEKVRPIGIGPDPDSLIVKQNCLAGKFAQGELETDRVFAKLFQCRL